LAAVAGHLSLLQSIFNDSYTNGIYRWIAIVDLSPLRLITRQCRSQLAAVCAVDLAGVKTAVAQMIQNRFSNSNFVARKEGSVVGVP
jgi:hypothetical protein